MARRGVTLVELLIVIVIMLMITGVVIRTTAPALTGRRVREAARMLDVYINGARSRALQTGRSYGVMIQRTPVLNVGTGLMNSSMGISVAYAEVPPPYTGDYSGSSTGSTIRLLGNGAFGPKDPNNVVPPHQDLTPIATDFTLNDVGWIQTVAPGDILVINATQFRIWAGEPFIDTAKTVPPYNGIYDVGEPYADCDFSGAYTPPNTNYIDPVTGFFTTWGGVPPPPGSAVMTYMYFDTSRAASTMNPTGKDLLSGGPILFGPSANVDLTVGGVTVPNSAPGYSFQIIRRPIKAAGTDQQLPDGAAIDLGGFDLSGANVVPGSGLDIYGTPPYFASFRSNPNYPSNPGAAPYVPDASPIIITFSPNGTVDKIYSWDERAFPNSLVLNAAGNLVPVGWQGRQPTSPIYLLVTRRELIGGDASVLTAPSSVTPQYGIQDLTSLWVTINPQTGLVNTAANGPIDPTLFTGTLYYIQCFEARQNARKTQTLGGR